MRNDQMKQGNHANAKASWPCFKLFRASPFYLRLLRLTDAEPEGLPLGFGRILSRASVYMTYVNDYSKLAKIAA
jgi:hypothetical protein